MEPASASLRTNYLIPTERLLQSAAVDGETPIKPCYALDLYLDTESKLQANKLVELRYNGTQLT